MPAQAIRTDQQVIAVPKDDVVRAWSVLEKVVLSLRNMGGHFSTPDKHTPLSPEMYQKMLEELNRFFTPELIREMGAARVALGRLLPEEEAEFIADNLIEFWTAPVVNEVNK